MGETFLRVFQTVDLDEVAAHLLIIGDLAGQCSACQAMDVPSSASVCPHCGTEFHYITFRNVQANRAKLKKIHAQRPSCVIIDHDDFKRSWAARKAQEFLE